MATNLHLLSSMFRRIMLQCPLRVVVLLILFTTGVADRALGSPAPSCTEREFLRLFPEAKKDGACYLFRLGECEIVAVTNTYGGGVVDMLFVHGAKQNDAKEMAEKLKSELLISAQIRPFEGKEPWVAIIPPRSGYYRNTVSRIIGYIIGQEDPKSPLQFLEWQGKQLIVRVEHNFTSPYLSTSSSSGRKSNGVIELSLDVTQLGLQRAELRVVKGKLTPQEVAIFVTRAMGGVYSSTQFMQKKELAALRKSFSNANIISYSSGANSCIVLLRRTYYYGKIDAVRESLSRQPQKLANFEFPQKESLMPNERRKMLAARQPSAKTPEPQVSTPAPTIPTVSPTTSPDAKKSASPLNFREAFSRYVSMLDKL